MSGFIEKVSFLIFAVLCFIPWGIPWRVLFPDLEGRGWDVIGINWLPGQYSLLFLAFVLMFARAIPIHKIKQGTVAP